MFPAIVSLRFLLLLGAVHVVDVTFATERETFFDANTAVNGAGGGVYCSKGIATFNGSSFTGNSAVWGGGEYLNVGRLFRPVSR